MDTSGAHARVKVLYATGATSNPLDASWSIIDVWTSGLSPTSDDASVYSAQAMIDDAGDLRVFWVNVDGSANRMYSARFNGVGFDAPELFYDSSLYPPSGSTGDPTMLGVSIALLAGTYYGVTSMNIDGSGFQTFYLTPGGIIPPSLTGYGNTFS